MISLLNNKIEQIKHKKRQNYFLLIKLGCMIFAAVLIAGFPVNTAEASTGLKIYDYTTNKTTTYTKAQIKVTCNGLTIGSTSTPGILVSGVALVPYADIFLNSDISADGAYDNKKGTITISKNGITIVMTIGSKKATVNGKTVTLSVAPMKIKYVQADTVKVLVPSRYVSETLGLGYTWYLDKSTVAIEKDSILLSFQDNKKFEYMGAQGKVTIDGTKVNLGTMPSIITNNTAMLRAKRVFADSAIAADYSYNKTNKTVTLIKGDSVIVMTIGSTKAVLNHKTIQMDTAPIIVKNYENNTSYVMVPGSFTAASLGYNYTWDNKTRTSLITSNIDTSAEESKIITTTDPELGDTDVVNETGTVLIQWVGVDSNYGTCSGVHELNKGVSSTQENGAIYSFSP